MSTSTSGVAAAAGPRQNSPAQRSGPGVSALLGGLLSQVGASGPGATTPASGPPELDKPPRSNCTSADVMEAMALMMAIMDTMVIAEGCAMDGQNILRKKKGDELVEKLQKAIAKAKEADSSSLGSKILNWFMKIFTVVAAVFSVVMAATATVASLGCAAALIALSAIALAMAVQDLAAEICKEAGGPDISLATGFQKMLQACGVSEEKAKEVGKWMALATMLVIAVACMVLTGGASVASCLSSVLGKVGAKLGKLSGGVLGGSLTNVSCKLANVAEKMTLQMSQALIGRAARALQQSCQLLAGASGGARAGCDAHSNAVNAEASGMRADAKTVRAVILLLQKILDAMKECLETYLKVTTSIQEQAVRYIQTDQQASNAIMA